MEKINKSLEHFNSKPLDNSQIISGPDQDDADSLISAAALRHFSSKKDTWRIPKTWSQGLEPLKIKQK